MRLIKFTYNNGRGVVPAVQFGGRFGAPAFDNELNWLFGSPSAGSGDDSQGRPFPVDLYEDKQNAYVRAELAGVNRDAINIEIVDGTLTLQATRTEKTGEVENTVSYNRVVSIPEDVQADKVSATYVNGILTVTLPRKEAAKPTKINVSVN
jgi:HSP20 family protein